MLQLEACAHPFFDELRDPNTRLLNGHPLPPLFNFTSQGKILPALLFIGFSRKAVDKSSKFVCRAWRYFPRTDSTPHSWACKVHTVIGRSLKSGVDLKNLKVVRIFTVFLPCMEPWSDWWSNLNLIGKRNTETNILDEDCLWRSRKISLTSRFSFMGNPKNVGEDINLWNTEVASGTWARRVRVIIVQQSTFVICERRMINHLPVSVASRSKADVSADLLLKSYCM